jgi:hypothetical protein
MQTKAARVLFSREVREKLREENEQRRPMSQTNVLPSQSLKLVSCPTLICLLLSEHTRFGTRTFRIFVPFPRLS